MPAASKRDKVVSLTKTKKKTKDEKASLIEQVRKAVEEYANVFVLSLENLRGTKFVQVRQHFKKTSRMFFGKNHLLAVALGRTPEDEIANDVHKVSNMLKGECCLMFTNESITDIKKYFKAFAEDDFARAGTTIDQTVTLPKGLLKNMPGSLEPQLRKLGLPTQLEKGEIGLSRDYSICKAGDILTPEQTALLKQFDIKTKMLRCNSSLISNSLSIGRSDFIFRLGLQRYVRQIKQIRTYALPVKQKEVPFSETTAFTSQNSLQSQKQLETGVYIPDYYDSTVYLRKVYWSLRGSLIALLIYVAFLRERSDLDEVLESPMEMLSMMVEERTLREQVVRYKAAGRDATAKEEELEYFLMQKEEYVKRQEKEKLEKEAEKKRKQALKKRLKEEELKKKADEQKAKEHAS
ncbi:ribosomal protein l10 domain-containing protein [Ditylenchus destructor]|nr:ribosomal protein l10 domain-containing protein [Ditylenchus destructor]